MARLKIWGGVRCRKIRKKSQFSHYTLWILWILWVFELFLKCHCANVGVLALSREHHSCMKRGKKIFSHSQKKKVFHMKNKKIKFFLANFKSTCVMMRVCWCCRGVTKTKIFAHSHRHWKNCDLRVVSFHDRVWTNFFLVYFFSF